MTAQLDDAPAAKLAGASWSPDGSAVAVLYRYTRDVECDALSRAGRGVRVVSLDALGLARRRKGARRR